MKINNIEEDINRINYIFEFQEKMSCQYVLDTEDGKAIQRILSDYKRVLKENESLQKTYDDCYCKYKHYMQFESISKSKIKDKIEELKKDKDSKYYYMFLEKRDIENTINVLKELLKEEK